MDSYCPYLWVGLNVLPDEITPCCAWEGSGVKITSKEDLNNVRTSPLFIKTREKMLKGERISNCKQCYYAEEAGIESNRQQAIKKYDRPTEIQLKHLDINFDNICNLKCRGCMSSSSHLWYNDEKEIYGETFFDKKYVEQDYKLDYSNLEVVNIAGGEPFLSPKFDKFLNTIDIENVKILISTNGTVKPSSKVFEKFQQCKELSINLSVDGVGKLNDYFRSNSVFSDILETTEYLQQLYDLRGNKSTQINIHTTVNIYNVNFLKEIEEYFTTKFPKIHCVHRILYWPEQLSIRNMPDDYKKIVLDIVEPLGEKYIDVINELKTPGKNLFDHFLNFHNKLDYLRNESLEDSNMLLSNYIKNYKKIEVDSRVFFKSQMDILR